MADTNERKRRALDSPLFKLIEETWIDYDSRITSFSISEEDVFRYTLWCIEGLKDNTGNRKRHGDKLRSLLFQQLRKRYGNKSLPEELNLLADIIVAYTLECLEWAQTADWTAFMTVYDEVRKSVITNEESILSCKKALNNKVFEMDLCTSFKQWIEDHLTNDVFLTEEDAEWAENIHRTKIPLKLPIVSPKTRSAGRPKATEKDFCDYVSEDIEESSVVDHIRESLTKGMGSASEVGDIIKNLFHTTPPSLKKVVPFNVLKLKFGDLIKCNAADYNKQVKELR